jgi:hypothetical protein
MEISRRFMPLLTELGGWGMDFCYKHVAPNAASALQRRLFNRAKSAQGSGSGASVVAGENSRRNFSITFATISTAVSTGAPC